MLKLTIGATEAYDEEKEEFVDIGGAEIELEHSLVSLSKWESEFQKPFLESKELSPLEILGYVRAMLLTPVSDEVLVGLTNEDVLKINDYISSSQSATTFPPVRSRTSRGERVTSELIYYWMVAYQIPIECETWNLNRLLNLVKICGIKNSKPQKLSKGEQARQMYELNQARKANLGTTG